MTYVSVGASLSVMRCRCMSSVARAFQLIGWCTLSTSWLLVVVLGSARPCYTMLSVAVLGFLQSSTTTYLIASSNTLFKFLCVNAEHSRYLTALISFAITTACSYCMGAILFAPSCLLTSSFSLRSSFVPTRMIGTSGA